MPYKNVIGNPANLDLTRNSLILLRNKYKELLLGFFNSADFLWQNLPDSDRFRDSIKATAALTLDAIGSSKILQVESLHTAKMKNGRGSHGV